MGGTYWFGLIIVSGSIGQYCNETFGWLAFGVGCMLSAIIKNLFKHLDKRHELYPDQNVRSTYWGFKI